ncbi:MAG: hypothetical protein BroJett038_26410 [Chloroflexota bacterium]|nr:MAG: hypothetical protein BroJett038_26410 [Chloroflexota bacterium]
MSYRDRDPGAQAAARATGCALALVIAAFVWLIYLLVEIFKYRPKEYDPATPYHATDPYLPGQKPFSDFGVTSARWLSLILATILFSGAGILLIGRLPYQPQQPLTAEHLLVTLMFTFAFGFPAVVVGLFSFQLWHEPPQIRALVERSWWFRYLNIPVIVAGVRSGAALLAITIPFLSIVATETTSVVRVFNGAAGGTMGATVAAALWMLAGWIGRRWTDDQRAACERAAATLQQHREQLRKARPCTVFTIYPPKGAKPDGFTGSKLLAALLATAPRLTFQISAGAEGIFWRVIDPRSHYKAAVITDHLNSHFPAAQIVVEQPDQQENAGLPLPYYRQHMVFGLAQEFAVPLPFLDQLSRRDPLTTLSQRLALLEAGDRVTYSVIVLVASPEAGKRALERFQAGYIQPATQVREQTQAEESRRFPFDEKLVTAKLSGPLYHAYLVVTLESSQPHRLEHLASVAGDIEQFHLVGHNGLRQRITLPRQKIETPEQAQRTTFDEQLTIWVMEKSPLWRKSLVVLSPEELAALWHLPDESFTSSRIQWAGTPVPAELTGEADSRVCIGAAVSPGQRKPIYLAAHDRAYHHYVAGKTGMGKSTLLHSLIHQDITAGHGVAVIDPHGKLIDDLLRTSLPRQRLADVVLLECGNAEYPVPLNPLRIPDGVSHAAAFNYLYWVTRKIYETVWRERMDLVYRNVLLALLCDPEATPLDIDRLFSQPDYRELVLQRMREHPSGSLAAHTFWDSFSRKSASTQAEMSAPILSRTGALLGNRALEQMTCHPHTLHFRDFIRERKIVLINLSGESVRAEVGSLGALFLAGFYMASEALGYIPDDAPPRYYLYVDEVERIITSPIPDMFSHERKFGLALTLANQYLEQLSEETITGILGNVGTKLIFECGERDARILENSVEPEFDRTQLTNLGAYRAVVKTRWRGQTLPAFLMQTYPPPKRTGKLDLPARKAQLLAQSGLLPAQAVREWLEKRYVSPPPRRTRRKTSSRGGDGLGDYE